MEECKHYRTNKSVYIASTYSDILSLHTEYEERVCKRCGAIISRVPTERKSFVSPTEWGRMLYKASDSISKVNFTLDKTIDFLNGDNFSITDLSKVIIQSSKKY